MILAYLSYITTDFVKHCGKIEEVEFSIDPSVKEIKLESEKLVRFEAVFLEDHWDYAHNLLEILQDGELGRVCVFRAPKKVEHQVNSLIFDLINLQGLL